ncbi:MAG: L-seryl-tRNA(Sec) selenium transferase [Aureliella sp.]
MHDISNADASGEAGALSKAHALRALPAVDRVLLEPSVELLLEHVSRAQCTAWIRGAIAEMRQRMSASSDGQPLLSDATTIMEKVVSQVHIRAASEGLRQFRPVINGTGTLLHTNLGRAPLAPRAAEAMHRASGFTNVEMDLETGTRSRRGQRVSELICELTGAEDAVVVNNCAAATVLVLQAIAQGREVVISRGQLVEIGGGFRLPDVFRAAGVQLREVGTTNRTYVHDYEQATGEGTAAWIRVHRSNFVQEGFVTEPTISELVRAQRPPGVALIDDIGSGWIGASKQLSHPQYAKLFAKEPSVIASVEDGTDLSLFSGDKLFGGPQAGIVIGKRAWIERLRKSPMMRAMRPDKMTLAGLEATVELHLAERADLLPLYQMLECDINDLRAAADSVVQQLHDVPNLDAKVIECQSTIGGGSMPTVVLPSRGVELTVPSSEQFARLLRIGAPSVVGRIIATGLLIDMRTVLADQRSRLTDALKTAANAM